MCTPVLKLSKHKSSGKEGSGVLEYECLYATFGFFLKNFQTMQCPLHYATERYTGSRIRRTRVPPHAVIYQLCHLEQVT